MNLIQESFLTKVFEHLNINGLIYSKILIDPNFTAIIFVDSNHFVRDKEWAKHTEKLLKADNSFFEQIQGVADWNIIQIG